MKTELGQRSLLQARLLVPRYQSTLTLIQGQGQGSSWFQLPPTSNVQAVLWGGGVER